MESLTSNRFFKDISTIQVGIVVDMIQIGIPITSSIW